MKKVLSVFIMLFITFSMAFGQNEEKKELKMLLEEFLNKVDSKEMHNRFWGEDLTYTSSSGKRHGKTTIMEGFSEDNHSSKTEGPKYWAEEVEIKVFDNIAIVTFRLMSKSANGEEASYLNSGTFIKRNEQWKVVNWQATKAAE